MSAGMADIIAAHSDVGVDPQSWAPGATIRWACYSCGAVEEAPSRETTKPEWHGQHLAAELTKAGYGLVQDAEAAALTDAADWFANGEAAGIIAYEGPSNRGEVTDAYDAALEDPETWLRERAATARTFDPAGLYRETRDGMAEAWREGHSASHDALNPYEDPNPLAAAMNDEEGRALVQASHQRKAGARGFKA